MDLSILLIAIGLAMDSFSVSIARGFSISKEKQSIEAVKTGFFFGLFQGGMPIIGWFVGLSVIDFISGFDHWIAFLLLCVIGIRMIYESFSIESNKIICSSNLSLIHFIHCNQYWCISCWIEPIFYWNLDSNASHNNWNNYFLSIIFGNFHR